MAQITFFTKLGCATAAKQIELLKQSGHQVEVRDLLSHPWTVDELRVYFGDLPVAAWFNEKSPRVKSGEIDPAAYDGKGALALMMSDHLLIHRPLMESGGKRLCGFDPEIVHEWVGLGTTVYQLSSAEDYNSCSQPPSGMQKCPEPA
jgi:nitrogenase-associated protein